MFQETSRSRIRRAQWGREDWPPNDGGNYIRRRGVTVPMKYRFYYTGIRVRNLTRSLAFYKKAFGMRVVNRGTMPHGGKYVQLEGAGSRQRLELNWYPPGSGSTLPIGGARRSTIWRS